jgi:group I intron endonuclease
MIKPLAGVYMILNLVTGDIYIGSAITGKMPNRFHKHLFGFSGNQILAAAVQKYGLSNFAFIVLETLPNVVSKEENKDLLTSPTGQKISTLILLSLFITLLL